MTSPWCDCKSYSWFHWLSVIKTNCFKCLTAATEMRTPTVLYECRSNLKLFSGSVVKFSLYGTKVFKWLVHEHENIKILLSSMKQFHSAKILALAEKVSSWSLFKGGTIWHISVPECHQGAQIIVWLETPPLLLVCQVNMPWQELGQGGGAFWLVYNRHHKPVIGVDTASKSNWRYWQ